MSLLRRFLQHLTHTFYWLSIYRERRSLNPLLILSISLLLTLTSAPNNITSLWVLDILYSVALIITYKPPTKALLNIYAVLTPLALIPGIPLLFLEVSKYSITYRPFNPESIGIFTEFVVRVLISPLPLITSITALGWPTIYREVVRFKHVRKYATYMNMFFILLRKTAYSLTIILAVRESRIVREGRSAMWDSLSTAVGDLLSQTDRISKYAYYAYIARCVEECLN